MAFGYVSSQLGFFGQLGTVNITITKTPSTPVVLTYSGLDSVLSSFTCVNCTNNYLIASGIAQYFQASQVTLTGTSNGVIYATVKATVYYVCSSIQGCRICSSSTAFSGCTTFVWTIWELPKSQRSFDKVVQKFKEKMHLRTKKSL